MNAGMEIGVFLAYAAGMLLIYIVGRYFMIPLRWIVKILINSVAGGVIILLLDSIGAGLGVFVPLNVFTALTVGLLGVPGLIMLLVFFL